MSGGWLTSCLVVDLDSTHSCHCCQQYSIEIPFPILLKMTAEVGLEENSSDIKNFNTEQESIPVGCVPPAY